MKRITLTDDLRARLHGLSGRVHLCGEDGKLLTIIEPIAMNGTAHQEVTLDKSLSQELGDLGNGIEFCDEQGKAVARTEQSTPWNDPENWEPQREVMTLEEMKHRRATEKTYTTDEVLEMLRSL